MIETTKETWWTFKVLEEMMKFFPKKGNLLDFKVLFCHESSYLSFK
jgi:hypothetical protein